MPKKIKTAPHQREREPDPVPLSWFEIFTWGIAGGLLVYAFMILLPSVGG